MFLRSLNRMVEWVKESVVAPITDFAIELIYRSTGYIKLRNIYMMHLGKFEGFDVWVWNGPRACRTLYAPWVMGGNHQRYLFNPRGELIVDSRIPMEEFLPTAGHEVKECRKMEELGWTYERAHDEGGLAVERVIRRRQKELVENKERLQARVFRGRWTHGLTGRRRRVSLKGIYRAYFGKIEGLDIWLVDASRLRRDIEPDFTFSGHDKEFRFIPANEIWIDAASPVADGFYHLIEALAHRRNLMAGMSRSDAYDRALAVKETEYRRQNRLCRNHERNLPPVPYGVRERGVKNS